MSAQRDHEQRIDAPRVVSALPGGCMLRLPHAAIAVAAALLWLQPLPAPAQQEAGLERLLAYRELSDVQMAPDGRRIVFVVESTDVPRNTVDANLWMAEPGSSRSYALTSARERAAAPAWSPDGARLAFLSDRGGPRQVWTIAPDGGEAGVAVPVERLDIRAFRWLPDGSGFLLLAAGPADGATARAGPGQGPGPGPGLGAWPRGARMSEPVLEPRVVGAHQPFQRLFRFRPGGNAPELLTREALHVTGFDVSGDGAQVVLATQPQPGHPFSQPTELKVLDLSSGIAKALFSQPTPVTDPQFSPDGQTIAFIARDDPSATDLHNAYLQVISTDGSGRRNLSRAVDENVLGFAWDKSGRSLVFWAFRGVTNKVYRVGLDGSESHVLEAFDEPWVLGRTTGPSFSADGRRGAAVLSRGDEPAEVYLIEGGGRELRRLTSLNQEFRGLAPEMEVIRYASPDGMGVEALLVRPRPYEPGRRYPLLVVVHGGPPIVFPYNFQPRRVVYPIFTFAAAGYAVLLPNPRGSTGYGEAFRRANIRDLGGGDFQDIMAGVDFVIEQGIADPDRLGLMGWSYGGQMAYWTVTHTDRFKAISAGAGITNLASHHGTGQARGYGQHDAYWGVTPWEDPGLYVKHSPLFHAQHAKTPLLIQHGEADPIVPLTQAQEFHSAAKRLGLTVEMVTYPGQGHMITPPNLLLDAMRRNLEWFDRWLSGVEPNRSTR